VESSDYQRLEKRWEGMMVTEFSDQLLMFLLNALDTAVILKVEKKKFFETRTLNAGLPPREEVVCRKRHSPMAAAA
jgi:hypothetical protein